MKYFVIFGAVFLLEVLLSAAEPSSLQDSGGAQPAPITEQGKAQSSQASKGKPETATHGWQPLTNLAISCDAPTGLGRLLFPGGRKKAITLGFDDGRGMDRRLVQILNTYGLRGTFNLVSGTLDKDDYVTRKEVKDLYKGHEVACHTVTHPPLTKQTDEKITQEVMDNRKDLEALVGYPVRGLAYPGGDANRRVAEFLPRLGIAYARTVGCTTWMALPSTPLLWAATCHHNNCLADGERLLAWPTYPALLYVWGHSYEFEEAKTWNLIEEFCRKVGGRKDIWYATNIEVVDYLRAAQNLLVTIDSSQISNPSALTVYIDYKGKTIELPPGKVTNLR